MNLGFVFREIDNDNLMLGCIHVGLDIDHRSMIRYTVIQIRNEVVRQGVLHIVVGHIFIDDFSPMKS